MSKFLDDFIKDLSVKDEKTLSQKTLKLVEEVGELAKVILPFDSAHGTSYRFTDKEKILEELVDVHLTNISILHSLGFSEDEFNDMLNKKSRKWSELQLKESTTTFPFEIHVTVDINSVANLDAFKSDCLKVGVKPIVLDLELKDGILKDVMTSSKHFGDNRSSYNESVRIATELFDLGYNVVRKKIETVPWHPNAPSIKDGKIPNGCYFESHIGVTIEPSEKDRLSEFVDLLNNNFLNGSCKLSQNFFKKSKDGGRFVNMLTYRDDKTCTNDFQNDVERIKYLLKSSSFEFEKVEIEYAIYDTNVNHDAKWIYQ